MALAAGAALIGATAGVGVGAAVFGGSSSLQLGADQPVVAAPSLVPGSYAAVAARILPSVVSITVSVGGTPQDEGSGVILRSDGYILTNNHVVAAAVGVAGSAVSVTFNDGSTATASIVGTDPIDDLAVIKVARNGLSPARLGDSASLRVGDPVLAVGSPLGLQGTVTNGIVSALNRPVQTQAPNTSPFGFSQTPAIPTVINAIQTDAPINPGNSGGPLVDMAGQVVGINSAIATLGASSPFGGGQSGNIGVGFAIPIDQARTIAEELITTGHVTHPILGISVEDVTSSNGASEVLVAGVNPGGPAAAAGMHKGDIIVALDGTAVSNADALIALVRSHSPGQQVSVTVRRAGKLITLHVTLGNAASSG